MVCPVDEFNASRHVGDDSPAVARPPRPRKGGRRLWLLADRQQAFFELLKTRIASARKYAPAARDSAMFHTPYRTGLRSEKAALLEIPDVHFARGPFGKLHVRFGKATHMSGPRPRCWTDWTCCFVGSWPMCARSFPSRRVFSSNSQILLDVRPRPSSEPPNAQTDNSASAGSSSACSGACIASKQFSSMLSAMNERARSGVQPTRALIS